MLKKAISMVVFAGVIGGGVFDQTETAAETEKLNKPVGFRAGLLLGPNFGKWDDVISGHMWTGDANPYSGFGFGIFADWRYFKADLGTNFENPDAGGSNTYFVIGGMVKIPIAAGNRLTIAPALGLESQIFLNDSDGRTRDDCKR